MKLNITGKKIVVNQKITDAIEAKAEKLSKFFTDDMKANVVIHPEKAKVKMETTLSVKGAIFRAEEVAQDVFDCIDICFDKLERQMSKYKGKLKSRYQSKDSIRFEMIPDVEDVSSSKIVRSKTVELTPMTPDEAALQMELLGHTFFVFLNVDTNEVNVVYKRNDSDYGLLETTK